MYAEHDTGEKELYDLQKDPFELQSRHDDPAYASVKAELAKRLEALRDCAGFQLPRLSGRSSKSVSQGTSSRGRGGNPGGVTTRRGSGTPASAAPGRRGGCRSRGSGRKGRNRGLPARPPISADPECMPWGRTISALSCEIARASAFG